MRHPNISKKRLAKHNKHKAKSKNNNKKNLVDYLNQITKEYVTPSLAEQIIGYRITEPIKKLEVKDRRCTEPFVPIKTSRIYQKIRLAEMINDVCEFSTKANISYLSDNNRVFIRTT